jgi:hypothetical protein
MLPAVRLLELMYDTLSKAEVDQVVAALPKKHAAVIKSATADARELFRLYTANEVS